jgi:alpha-L-glutamate ligase-like protein
MVAEFYTREDVFNFNWDLPENGFVIKPARGYGGGGILAIEDWKKGTQVLPEIVQRLNEKLGKKHNVLRRLLGHVKQDEHTFIGTSVVGELYSQKQLESLLLDILDGAYSLQFLPDKAFIEERVIPDSFFRRLGAIGIPDIRIIVFQHVPVMAMIRLPNTESGGKANLQLGAIALGLDMRTGITTYATHHNKLIDRIPNTKLKASGIKVPHWEQLLLLASKAQAAIGLGFAGVDIVFDAQKGPLVLEINSRPGLKIQNANLASLRTRLERVEGMDIPTPERGVELAKSIFAEKFSEKVFTDPKVLSIIQPVTIRHNGIEKNIEAKIDTGALRTSLDIHLAKSMGLPIHDETVFVKSASGMGYRPTVRLSYELAGRKIHTIASIVDRSQLRYPMIIGRMDLKGFLVRPEMAIEEDDEGGN